MSDPLPYVAAAFRGRGRSRSQVYLWLSQHYDELVAAKLPGTRVDWVSVTDELKRLGFKAEDKSPLKPGAVRRMWYRVDADRKRGILPPPPDTQARASAPKTIFPNLGPLVQPVSRDPPDAEPSGAFEIKTITPGSSGGGKGS